MPPFDHLHPAVVHFAIAPLSLAPVLVLLGLVWRNQRRGVLAAALVLLALGLVCAGLALATGQAAERFARATPELRAAAGSHEKIALLSTQVFAGLTSGLLLLWLVPAVRRRELKPALEATLLLVWLLASLAGVGLILRTGHEGGTMVHALGTHARQASTM